MTMPNFLIIGAQKAGTTSLYRYLKEHPQIFMSSVKEPGFFAFDGDKPSFCGPGDERLFNRIVTNIDDYCQLFAQATDEIAIGEATTLYLQSPEAAKRIKQHIPNVKLIVILRHPVDRAYSAFMHLKRDSLEEIEDFPQALMAEEQRIKDNWGFLWQYKSLSLYSKALETYFDYFDPQQIRVYLYEEFNRNPQQVLQDIFSFLQVDDKFIPDVLPRYNISGIPKNKTLYSFLSKENRLKTLSRVLIPDKLRKQIAYHITRNNLIRKKLDPKQKRELGKMFKDDLIKTQTMMSQDLSAWLSS